MTSDKTARRVLQLIDLTSLNDDDNEEVIIRLCEKAYTQVGNVAAVCVYPQFIQAARATLEKYHAGDVKVATVVNFPTGENDIEKVISDTQLAVNSGANEVDLVFPYQAFINGNTTLASTMIKACKQVCAENVLLKVIIESGELKSPELIKQACQIAIAEGGDFIKTSTGKVEVNATLEAAKIILCCIKDSGNKHIGFKAAGGISSVEEAAKYLSVAESIMGPDWPDSAHFRFGASSLLNDVLLKLGIATATSASAY